LVRAALELKEDTALAAFADKRTEGYEAAGPLFFVSAVKWKSPGTLK
jgi:hypothetical protein